MATKSSGMNLGFNFEGAVKEIGKVVSSGRELDKTFAGITGSASKYVESFTKSLKDLTSVSDKLPVTSKSLKTIFDSVDNLRVNKDKPVYIEALAKSLTKFYTPLHVLTELNIDPAITRLNNLFTSFEKIPSKAKVDNLNALAGAIRKFSSASKTLQGIPTNIPSFGGGGGGGGLGGGGGSRGGGGSGGSGGGGGGTSPTVPPFTGFPASPGMLPSFQGTGQVAAGPWPPSLALPSFGGTGVAPPPTPPPMTGWNKVGSYAGKGIAALKAGMSDPATMTAVYALGRMVGERSSVNEELGTTVDFNLAGGTGKIKGSTEKQQMLDFVGATNQISYRDAASLMTSYRKYSSGGLRNTGMAELGTSGSSFGFADYAAGSRRLSRQLGIDLDEAGDIQGSSRKNLGMNSKQFREFGDSMVYLSRNAAMSKKEVMDLGKEIQTVGVVTGRTGEAAKTFSQNMMAAGGALSEVGVSGNALSSIQKGFTGDMQGYLLNKQMGITSAMKPQEQVMAQQQFVASRLQSLAGMDPETRNLMIGMMQSKGLLPADMSIAELTKLSQADPAEMQKQILKHTQKIKEEQGVQGMGLGNWFGSGKNMLMGSFGTVTNSLSSLAAFGSILSNPSSLIEPLYKAWSMNSEKKAAGGIVGGSGESDSVPAMLTPGEEVLRKDDPRHKNNIMAFNKGGVVPSINPKTREFVDFVKSNISSARVTSEFREGAHSSHGREGGKAVDFGLGHLKPGSPEFREHVKELQMLTESAGWFGQLEAPGQVNPNGSKSSGWHWHTQQQAAKKAAAREGGLLASVPSSITTPMEKASATITSVGSSVMSHLKDALDFIPSFLSNTNKQTASTGAQTSADLLRASTSNNDSADKISQAADVMMQAAQTMSTSIVAQSSRGNSEQQYRIANIARGNMVS